MKKSILLSLFLFTCMFAFAQDSTAAAINIGSFHLSSFWVYAITAAGGTLISQYAGKVHDQKLGTVIGILIQVFTLILKFLVWLESKLPGSDTIKSKSAILKSAITNSAPEVKMEVVNNSDAIK